MNALSILVLVGITLAALLGFLIVYAAAAIVADEQIDAPPALATLTTETPPISYSGPSSDTVVLLHDPTPVMFISTSE